MGDAPSKVPDQMSRLLQRIVGIGQSLRLKHILPSRLFLQFAAKQSTYTQVEVFANSDYKKTHCKTAKILNKDKKQLENLLSIQPDVLVIGDSTHVLYTEDKNNWCRLTEISDKVHLGFLELFEWDENHLKIVYFILVGYRLDVKFTQKLKRDGATGSFWCLLLMIR